MKRVRILCLAVIFMVYLSGCVLPFYNNGGKLPDQPWQRPDHSNAVIQVDYLDSVTSIEVTDVAVDMYTENLSIMLTTEEIEALKELKDTLELSDKSWNSKDAYDYKLKLYNADGDLVTSWRVTNSYYIRDGWGQCFDENEELKAWIDAIEDSHNIYGKIYDRTQGENYFYVLSRVEKGNAKEVVDYDAGLEYIYFDLDEEDIESFQTLEDSICVIEEPRMSIDEMHELHGDLYYTLDVYTEEGCAYHFYITYDGTIYVRPKYAFVVTGEGVEEWFRTLEAKYGLDQIEN